MGKTTREAAPEKRTSAYAHRLKRNIQKGKSTAKNRKPSKEVKRGASALLKGDQALQAVGKRSKLKLQEAVLNESKDVVIRKRRRGTGTSSKKGTLEAKTKKTRKQTHAQKDPLSGNVPGKDDPNASAGCIWEVNPSSSDTELKDSTPTSPKDLKKATVAEVSAKSEKTAIHDSPSITVVDLGTDFRSGIRQTVSLAQTKRGKRKKNWESFPRSHQRGEDVQPETRKLWTSMEDIFVQGDKHESFASEEKPMQSVFIVDLGVNQSRGDCSNTSPSLKKSSKSRLNAKPTSEIVSAEASGKGFKSISNGLKQHKDQIQKDERAVQDIGNASCTPKKGVAKRKEKRTSSKSAVKKLKRGHRLENNSSSEEDNEAGASSSPIKEATKRKTKAKEEISKGSLMQKTAKLSKTKTAQKEEENDRQDGDKQDGVVHSDSSHGQSVANNQPGTAENSPDAIRLEPAFNATTEDAVDLEDDNGRSSESPMDEREADDDASPVDQPLETEMQFTDKVQNQPSYRIIKLLKRDQCLLLLPHPSKFSFHGRALVRALHGSVTVLGFPISADADPTFYPLYSPSSSCALCLETMPGCLGNMGETSSRSLTESLEAFLGAEDETTVASSFRGLEEFTIALILKKMPEDHVVAYVESFPGFGNLFSSPEPKEYTQPDESWSSNLSAAAAVGIQPTAPNTPGTVFSTLPGYRTVTQSLNAWHRASHFPTVVLVCGWKNTGKSTLCRYLSNSVLSSEESVCYLECDMAQTEFTAPGILSLQCISQPLLGPPFTHSRKAEKMCFYGDVNVRGDPESYLQMVKYLFQQYQTRHADKPLIINTMGWMQGLGLQLLIDIIHITRPTHIVQLWSRIQPRLIQRLTPEFLEQTEGWWHRPADDGSDGNDEGRDGALCPDILEVDVPSVGDQAGTKFKASDHRTMALLACLSKLQPFPMSPAPVALSSLTPLVLPWKSVAVHVTNGHVSPRHVMYALNGCIVGLCCANPSLMRSVSPDLPRVFDSTPVCNCLGLGIIRGIDPVQKLFYVLTGVSQDALQEVNTLLKGSLTLPQPLLTQGHCVKDVPYLSREFSSVVIGSSAIKVRRNIKQRGR